MSEWKDKILCDVVSMSKGKLTQQSESPIDDFLPLINTDAVNGKSTIYSASKGAILCTDTDVLMLWDGERSGLVTIGHSGVVGSTFAKLKVFDFIDSKYLFYFLDNRFSWIQNQRTGTGVPHVPKNLDKILWIKYPEEISEQRQISHILSTCDAVIEKTQAAIAKYKAIKQGMLHDLFTRGVDITTGKLRPKYEDAPALYKESKLGMVPKEWEVETFEETTLKIADRDHFTPIYVDSGVAIISPKDFDENEEISFSECKYITYEAHLKNAEKTDLKTGDLVFTRIGALLGKVCMVEEWMPEFSILHSACMIRVNPKSMDGNFYLQFIKSYFFQGQIKMEIQSIGVPDLGLDKIKSFLVFRPSLIEQRVIGAKLISIDRSIKYEKIILNKLQQLKAGLMADLLSGKKRVPVPEEATTQTEN